MDDIQLTAGFICHRLYDAEQNAELLASTPIVQILSIKPTTTKDDPQVRYRLILSDGEYFDQSMLQINLNKLVEQQDIIKYTLVALLDLEAAAPRGQRLLIVKNLHVVARTAERIGDVKPLRPRAGTASPATQQPSLGPASHAEPATATATASAPAPHPSPGRSATPASNMAQTLQAPASSSAAPPNPSVSRDTTVIAALTPYSVDVTILAQVGTKTPIRSFKSGQGQFFKVTFKDRSGHINGTAFGEEADRLFNLLQRDRSYYISQFNVKPPKAGYGGDFEILLTRNTTVEECGDAETGSQSLQSNNNYTRLCDLHTLQKDTTCDVIGVVTYTGTPSEVNFSGSKTSKLDVTITDETASITVVFWGDEAQRFHQRGHHSNSTGDSETVLSFSGIKVKNPTGYCTLSVLSTTFTEANPSGGLASQRAQEIRTWYNESSVASQKYRFSKSQGSQRTMVEPSGTLNNISLSMTDLNLHEPQLLNDVKHVGLGMRSPQAEAFVAQGTVLHIKDLSKNEASNPHETPKFVYPACASAGCNKKVVLSRDGGWHCAKCNSDCEYPRYRYMMQLYAADMSGGAWMGGFDDVGESVFGVSANDLVEKKTTKTAEYTQIVDGAIGKTFSLACLAKQEEFNDKWRIKYGIQRLSPIDYGKEAKYLKALLDSPWGRQ